MIEIRNLAKTYHGAEGNFTAVKNINLTINDGDIFGIIGLSGAGKSTLVRCINLLEVPTEGDVLVDGKSMLSLSRRELLAARQKIVEGAVGMVEMALDKLSEQAVVELDEERKAAMVSNLLVVLCGNKEAQPIVNSGSIY